MQVLVVNAGRSVVEGAKEALRRIPSGLTTTDSFAEAARDAAAGLVDAVIVSRPPAEEPDRREEFDALMRIVSGRQLAAIVLSGDADHGDSVGGLIESVGLDVSAAELRGRLVTIHRYHAIVRRLERELQNMERLGKRLNQHFLEIDQEMRLAARLQQDFLPDLRKSVGGVRFAAVYRPASWVSGDIYDAFRVDENHVGFYVADAVGHGMAAGLLTMYIKRAIVPKIVLGDGYEICSPARVISALNDALIEQALPRCQFITASYGLLNTSTGALQVARGGHPYPLIIDAQGRTTELLTPGGLLGLTPGEDFPERRFQLRPDDKLILYSDGAETAFHGDGRPGPKTPPHLTAFAQLAHLPVEEMMMYLGHVLDGESGSLAAQDDVTILGLEMARSDVSRDEQGVSAGRAREAG